MGCYESPGRKLQGVRTSKFKPKTQSLRGERRHRNWVTAWADNRWQEAELTVTCYKSTLIKHVNVRLITHALGMEEEQWPLGPGDGAVPPAGHLILLLIFSSLSLPFFEAIF